MRLAILIISIFLAAGCTTMDQRKIISPSDSLYYKANNYFEDKDFVSAIELYEQYLEEKPRSNLSVPAKLNLGMSFFYLKNYKDAYTTLKETDTKDENIKSYIDGILAQCEAEAGDEIRAEMQTEASTASSASAGAIEISVTDAYLDDFGSVILKGEAPSATLVQVSGTKADLNTAAGTFRASTRWSKGEPIEITAVDASGAASELDYYPDRESPDEPEGLRIVSTTENSAEIEWDKDYDDEIKGYRMFYIVPDGGIREVPDLIEDTKHEVVGLQTYVEGANKTFRFYIRAVDRMDNESDDSDILAVTIP